MWRLLLLWIICGNIWAKDVIVYPRPEAADDHRGDYAVELLRLALTEAGADFSLQPAAIVMTQERAFAELRKGNTVNVMWTMTTQQREAQALPIRIPIYKGLIGWRLPLVHTSRVDLLAQVHTKEQLAAFVAGQSRDWPDADILIDNDLLVSTSSSYSSLFQMLSIGRFDYMPRSVVEIWDEAEAHRANGLTVDPHIALHYPAAVYFFVNQRNAKLAQKINAGLEKALANGKFNRLFYSHHAKSIERARLSQRTVIELQNRLLPKETPLHRKELWDFPVAAASRPNR